MAGKGPPKTPTAILEKRGSWIAKTRSGEPIVPSGEINFPEWLDPKVEKYWIEIESLLRPLGVLTPLDVHALGMVIGLFAEYVDLKEQFETKFKGQSIIIIDGKPKKNPLHTIMMDYWDRIMRGLQQFGMTPSSRASISVGAPQSLENEKSRFFND